MPKLTFKNEKRLICACLILYVIFSQILLPYLGKSEIFPVFQWTLFSRCDTERIIPEIEIYLNSTEKITSKQFPRFLQWKVFFLLRTQVKIENKTISRKNLKMVLNEIAKFIKNKPFQYRIFKSRVNLIEYAKKDSLTKQYLLKSGSWEKSQ